jgi:chemotaxis protein histidine kinase CheA/ActR/RegA family two-component response regulator
MTEANEVPNEQPAERPSSATDAGELRAKFAQLADFGAQTSHPTLQSAASLCIDLLAVANLFCDADDTRERGEQIMSFCRDEALPALTECDTDTELQPCIDRINNDWGNCFEMLAPEERFHTASDTEWSPETSSGWPSEEVADVADYTDGDQEFGQMDVSGLLASLSSVPPAPVAAEDDSHTNEDVQTEPQAATGASATPRTTASGMPRPPEQHETINDPEMLAAYADDAQLCLGEMEGCLLNSGADGTSEEAQRNFCRQLHTLKGASGTVGLALLAGYLHDVESWIEGTPREQITVDTLLECVDAVRAQLVVLGIADSAAAAVPAADTSSSTPAVADEGPPPAAAAASTPATPRSSSGGSTTTASANSPADVFVRVEASRLERLMDLLAELVMLRNRRETHVTSVRALHDEFNLCAARTRALTTTIELPNEDGAKGTAASPESTQSHMAHRRFLSRSLDEIAADTVELSRSLQEVFDPLAEDNSAVSHLIGRFRQELMELRRLPVSGLFQRLQRSIHDAARAEDKQVEIKLEGQGARAERAVQERLFEPLLHLVRNAVSHGIQNPQERIAAGKPAKGTITLAASSDAASLCVEIRDDGAGLNEDALEARGRSLGLLQPGEIATREQIRQLIFEPGFSTKTTVSKISGRGVGMDVVNTWVRRLRGRIDVESVPGEGTTFRLQIPLRSAVEHAMIVRAGDQLFALPMHTVSRTSDSKLSIGGVQNPPDADQGIQLSKLLNLESEQVPRRQVTLRGASGPATTPHDSPADLTITVDAIVGVEEVVVRSLPALLQRNELFVGVTLSGRAETVFLLDAQRLIELARSDCDPSTSPVARPDQHSGTGAARELPQDHDVHAEHELRPCILIVDDSVVVRRSLSRKLNTAGFDTREAGNGMIALKLLRSQDFAAVVTDVDMPEMSGLELLHEMRRQKQLRQIPVTILSSRDREAMPQELLELRPNAVLAKPVTEETIAAIVDTLAEAPVFSS